MSAKKLMVRPVSAQEANALVKRVHYSGKVVPNSQVHLGVYWHGTLEGAIQLGPSIQGRATAKMVEGSTPADFLEINRMAFTDRLPRNSESRALGVSMRILRKHAPWLRWVLTFADGTQCGDGTIYRAAGFLLTDIRPNTSQVRLPDGSIVNTKTLNNLLLPNGQRVATGAKARGAVPLPGHQLRYVHFLDPSWRERLAVPVLSYQQIEARGASMYRGKSRAGNVDSDVPAFRAGEGGAIPTPALHRSESSP